MKIHNLQLVEDGCLPSIVQTHYDDFVFCRKVHCVKFTLQELHNLC